MLAIAVLVTTLPAIGAATGLFATVGLATWLSLIDFREHRLPNPIVGGLAAIVVAGLLIAATTQSDFARFGRSILIGLGLSAVLLCLSMTGGLGAGDAKFMFPIAAVTAWFGSSTIVAMVLVMTVSGGVVSVGALLAGKGVRYRLSYGPYMALGYAIALVLQGADII